MAITPLQLDDLVSLTLDLFKRHKWVDISLEHQEYCALSAAVRAKRVVEWGGPQISWRVQVKNTGNARVSGLFDVDETKVDDVMQTATAPWAKLTTNFSYDVDEDSFQSDKETIIGLIKVRYHDAMNDMAELMEEQLWGEPSSSSDKSQRGIPFWIQKDATTTVAGGFNGTNPSGDTTGAGGLSSATYPRWTNWTFGYTNPTTSDLLSKVRKSMAMTYFMAPDPYPELAYGSAPEYGVYTTYRVTEPLERLAESRNDNLKNELTLYQGNVVIRGNPVKWVPFLEANDTSDPIYGVNWQVFRPFVKKGRDMRRNPPKQAAHQHSVREVHFDHWANYACYNRRLTWVGSKS